jgi:serine/threonine protein kinase
MPPSAPSGATAARGTTSGASIPQRIGRFEIRARLGAGAFGAVYRAYDPQLDREVALKVPHAGTLENSRSVDRFLREAKAAAQLRHPHIVPIHDAGQDGAHHFIASAFIAGRTLQDGIDEGGLDLRASAQIVREMGEALAYAHSLGIVHRDVKSANTMLDTHGQAHIMDFGLAHRLDSAEKMTQDGAILGTPSYMAPSRPLARSATRSRPATSTAWGWSSMSSSAVRRPSADRPRSSSSTPSTPSPAAPQAESEGPA